MSRRPIDDAGAATETLTLRLSLADRDLLNRLVSLRAGELAEEGVEVTAASYVRGLIRREAKVKGLLDERAGATLPTHVPVAEPLPKRPRAGDEPDAEQVRDALTRALKGDTTQAEIGRMAQIDSGQLSRFKSGRANLSPEALRRLAAAVKLR